MRRVRLRAPGWSWILGRRFEPGDQVASGPGCATSDGEKFFDPLLQAPVLSEVAQQLLSGNPMPPTILYSALRARTALTRPNP